MRISCNKPEVRGHIGWLLWPSIHTGVWFETLYRILRDMKLIENLNLSSRYMPDDDIPSINKAKALEAWKVFIHFHTFRNLMTFKQIYTAPTSSMSTNRQFFLKHLSTLFWYNIFRYFPLISNKSRFVYKHFLVICEVTNSINMNVKNYRGLGLAHINISVQ